MFDELRPYPGYRQTDIPWIPQAPTHWDAPLNQRVFRETTRPYAGTPETQLSLSQRQGLVPTRQMEERSLQTSSFDKWKVVLPGDLVVNRFKAHLGVFFAATQRGITTFHYGVFQPKIALNSRYFELLFHTPQYCSTYAGRSNGMTVGLQNLSNQNFYNVRTLVPPPDEQAAIVRFLDHADRRIRRYIRAKQKLIKLLEEQKQAIIHQAVTRGLDPSVPMKDSGLPWVPRVPSHWSLTPNRAHLKIRKVLVGARHTEFQLLSLTKRGVIVRDLSENKGKFSADLGTSQEVRSGDLVFCLFDVPETPRTVGLSSHDGMITSAYTVFECRDPSVARFIEAFYIAMDDRKLLSPLYSGLRNTVPKERLLGAKTPLPDDAERAAILDHIASASAGHDAAIDRARREIALLRELRTRLIADVVTGQLDVRAAAAALPDEPTDDEPLDDADETGDDDLDADGDAAPEDDEA